MFQKVLFIPLFIQQIYGNCIVLNKNVLILQCHENQQIYRNRAIYLFTEAMRSDSDWTVFRGGRIQSNQNGENLHIIYTVLKALRVKRVKNGGVIKCNNKTKVWYIKPHKHHENFRSNENVEYGSFKYCLLIANVLCWFIHFLKTNIA